MTLVCGHVCDHENIVKEAMMSHRIILLLLSKKFTVCFRMYVLFKHFKQPSIGMNYYVPASLH